MPQTRKALDSLIARLLRTETIMAIVVIILEALDVFGSDAETAAGGGIAIAVFLGRSIVKASGYKDNPDGAADPDAIQV